MITINAIQNTIAPIFFYLALVCLLFKHTYSYAPQITEVLTSPAVESVVSQVATAGLEVVSEVASAVAAPVAYITLASELYDLTKSARSYLAPSTQEQCDAQQIERDIKTLNAQKDFGSCLMSNRCNCQVDDSGIPAPCETAAYVLAMLAGQEEVERLAEIVNKYRK